MSVGVFFVIGLLLDGVFETKPVFILACTIFSMLGSFARLWYVYDTDMRTQEFNRRAATTQHMQKSDLASRQ